MSTYSKIFKSGLIATAALSMTACGSSGSYRLSSVGSVPDNGGASADTSTNASGSDTASTGGGSSSSGAGGSASGNAGSQGTLGSGRVLVTAGNAVMGAGRTAGATSLVPVTGTVAGVLGKTGQTLVDLGNGDSVILNRTGGRVGDAVKVDLGKNTVVGAPKGSPLLGASVLPSSSNPASATVGRSGLLTVNANNSPATTTVTGAVTPPAGANSTGTGLINGVTSTVNGLVPKK